MNATVNSGQPFDPQFVLWLVGILSTGVLATIFGLTVVGCLAIRANREETFMQYMQIFSGGEALRMLCVSGILVSVMVLAFAKLIDGTVASSILSGMAGFVLGGVNRTKEKSARSGEKGASSV